MPDCGSSSCNCSIQVGPGLTKSGTGSLDSPFIISLAGTVEDSLIVEDSSTIDLSLTGGGTPADAYRLTARAKVRVVDLTDVFDPEGAPNAGDTLVFVTSGVETPRWEFRPPPANPAGAVNVSDGITGQGTAGDPIRIRSAVASGGSTSGLAVYVDSAGNLRATAPSTPTVEWSGIQNKPASFATTPGDFTGVLPVAKGGTGEQSLAAVKVGDSTAVDGRRIFVQSSTPPTSGVPLNSLWFW